MKRAISSVLRKRARLVMASVAFGTLSAYALVVAGAPPAESASKKPPSGGGDAPHGALPMDRQTAATIAAIKPLPHNTAPAGIDPCFWEALVPKDNAPPAARRARAKALLRHAALGRRHRRLRHLPRRQPRLHRPAAGLGGHRRPARPAQRADDAERAASSRPCSSTAARRRLEEQAKLPIVNPIEMGQPDGDAAVAGDRRRRRVPAHVPGGLRPAAELRRRRPRHRHLRAHAGLPRRAVRPLPRRRRERHLGAGAGGLGALQRQGALRDLPHAEPVQPARHRQPLPQHRRLGAPPGLRGARRARRSTALRGKDGGASKPSTSSRSRPTSPSSAASWSPRTAATSARFKTSQLRNIGITAPVHARRLDADAVGRDGPLQQGRRGQPVSSTAASSRWR